MSAVEAIDHSLRRAFANCFILLFSEVVGFLAKNNLFLTKQTGPFKKIADLVRYLEKLSGLI